MILILSFVAESICCHEKGRLEERKETVEDHGYLKLCLFVDLADGGAGFRHRENDPVTGIDAEVKADWQSFRSGSPHPHSHWPLRQLSELG